MGLVSCGGGETKEFKVSMPEGPRGEAGEDGADAPVQECVIPQCETLECRSWFDLGHFHWVKECVCTTWHEDEPADGEVPGIEHGVE